MCRLAIDDWRLGQVLFLLVAALFAGALSCGSGTDSDSIRLSFGHVGAPGSLFARSADEFARRVNERLAGQVEVQVFGSSQLGGDEVLLRKLKLGTVDFSLPSTIMSSYVDAFGLFEMPYLVRSREHMKRIEDAVFWSRLSGEAEAAGYKILAVWENGFRHITNNLRPIREPQDLTGIKLRTPAGRWRLRMFQALGANPTPMALSEVFVALQTGVMDGQENPLIQIYSSRLHEVQKYLSLTSHVYTPAFLTVSVSRWQRLPPETRSALEDIARQVQTFVHETAARLDQETLEELRDAGLEINQPGIEDFREASQKVYEEFSAEVPGGAELIEAVLEAGGSG